jgi:NAD(P)-dependent dehydrogenase (short-subunit alcohol dehydrogenase family)
MENIVLITGVSTGFGHHMACEFLSAGYRVIGTLRGGEERAHDLFRLYQKEIEQKKIVFVDLDLLSTQSIEKFCVVIQKILNGKKLNVFINNAGASILGPLELMETEDIQNLFQLNLFSPLKLIRSLIPYISSQNGKIFNMTSMASYTTFPFYGVYSASKAALEKVTEGLFYELRSQGIQVCAIAPGGYQTSFNRNSLLPQQENISPVLFQKYKNRLEKFSEFIKLVDKYSDPHPEKVARVIVKMAGQKKIPLKKRFGIDAKINWIFDKIIPTQLRFLVTDWLYRKFLF